MISIKSGSYGFSGNPYERTRSTCPCARGIFMRSRTRARPRRDAAPHVEGPCSVIPNRTMTWITAACFRRIDDHGVYAHEHYLSSRAGRRT